MCVVSHSYGGLVGSEMEVVDVKHAGQSREELVACLPDYEVKTLRIPNHTTLQVRSSEHGLSRVRGRP